MCKVFSNYIERDGGINIAIGQDIKNKHTKSQEDFYLSKEDT
jgi:hypothetical protein